MTPRLHVSRRHVSDGRIRIAGAELRHLRTLRLAPGALLVVFDEEGHEHDVRLEHLTASVAEGTIMATRQPMRDSRLDLVLAAGLLKGAKMDLVVEKATELGVRRVVPLVTARAVAQGARLERWQRIALAAAKQCGRTAIPSIEAPTPLATAVRQGWPGARVLVWEGELDQPLTALPPAATAAIVLVGPEGGFTPDEVADATLHGFAPVTLGPRILRAETAALVAVALCQHRWGDLSSTVRLG